MRNKLKEILNNITLYSAALSFYTIFSLVPILLIILSIFSSTPYFEEYYLKFEHFLTSNILPTKQELISEYLKNFLHNSSKMGIIGGFYILITSILFFDNYETIISKIFNQPKRNLWEKIKLYWTMLTLFPLFFSSAIYLSVKFQLYFHSSLSLLPFLLMWLSFFLAYKLTLINEDTAATAISSFFVTVAFFILKAVFVYYLLINKTYTTIYGSISLFLYLLLWIYINWIIYISGMYLIKFFTFSSPPQQIYDKFMSYVKKSNTK
ncbi:MAG: YihY family inner membrane protein [Epsilonproteobacteria bacterium]|nr:YihY family inner membrane protein [Campylobacterota bacterium]